MRISGVPLNIGVVLNPEIIIDAPGHMAELTETLLTPKIKEHGYK